MHTVERYENGRWVVAASFERLDDAYDFAGSDGLVMPAAMSDRDRANRRLDWLEAVAGWFAAPDELPR